MKKLISVFTALTTILWLMGAYLVLPVKAVTFTDGALARESDEFDVYIIKLVGAEKFKRLILNPDVFNMYGHLKWSNVQVVADGTLADYTTSELVREINDTKVYKLYPDGDVGTKKWVETLDCFTTQGYNWNSVYIINSFDRDSYTTAATTLCGGAAEVGAITLSLASDSPKAVTIPKTAQGVTFIKVKVEGSGKISQVTVKRSGAGSVDDFDNVYVYQDGKRLTSGRTISSASSKVTFIGLKLSAPTTFDIVADVSAVSGGNQDYFVIESASDVTADATVGGSFPISGNAMSFSGTDAGTLTVERSGSTAYNVTIGEIGVEVSQFKVTTGTEGTKISRIQLFNSGTITTTKLTNVKLKVGGTEVASGEFSSDGYVVFSLATPYEITKGNSAIFRVYADISGGKPAENVKLYLELATDILGLGTTLGYGMTPTITSYDSDTYVTATLTGGDLTMVKTGPNAGNIGTKTSDTVFLELAMSAAADITISRTRLAWCINSDGDATYDAAGTDFTDVEDVKITNKDTGVVWAGPHDGSAFVTATTTALGGMCPGSIAGVYKDYTDTFDLAAGSSYNLKITADVKIANTANGNSQIDANDIIKIIWVSYPTIVGTSGNVNYVKYTNTTNAVDDSAMIPSGDIAGEEMTIKAASLAVTLAGSPAGTDDGAGLIGTARKFVKGEQAVDAVGLVFTAGVASDMKVTDLTLSNYVDCDGAGLAAPGVYTLGLQGSNCYTKNLISSVKIYEKESGNALYATAKGFSGTSYENVAYSGLNWTIPAGESRTLLVKSNISSIGPTESTGFDMVSFDILTPSTDITCQDKDSNSVTATGTSANGATNPNVAIGVYNYGSITIAKSDDTPLQSILTMGSTNNEVSKFKLTGTVEGFYIEKYSIKIDEDLASRSNFTGLALKYQTTAQSGTSDWTVSTKKTFGSTATLSFNFTGDARPYVPKDDSSYITAVVDVEGYNAGKGAKSGDYTQFWTAANSSNEFTAYGSKSGHLFNGGGTGVTVGTDNEIVKTGINNHYIFRSRPVFAKKAWSGDINELARFSITAQGYDVTFDGTDSADIGFNDYQDNVVSTSLEFDVIASGTDETDQTFSLYRADTNEVVSSVSDVRTSHADAMVLDTDDQTYTSTISFHFEEYTSAIVIAKDATKEFYVMLDNTVDFNNQDEYLQLKLLNDQGDITTNYGAAADTAATYLFSNCNIVWYDGTDDESTRTTFEHRICMPASTRGIGDLPLSFRLLQGTAQ